jgi:uncharacterized membrane protein YkoI
MRARILLVPLTAAMMLGLAACSSMSKHGDDDKNEKGESSVEMTLDQVPPAVRATIEAQAAGAKIEEVDKETENGATVYETDVTVEGKEYEIKVAEDGKLISKKLEEDDEKGEKDDDDDKK